MPVVTVPGAHHTGVTLTYDLAANAAIARQIAAAITAGVANGTIIPFDNTPGLPPAVPPGETGEFVQLADGTTFLPAGYDDVVDAARSAVIYGNGDANEQVLAGGGNLTFFALGGTGSVIAGGGDDMVSIAPSDAGAWLIAAGNGDDTIRALGSGNDTIGTGAGNSLIQLGAGKDLITTLGSATVLGGSGRETIDASGCGTSVIYGESSKLFFVASGAATVIGGSGSDTVYGGNGPDLLEGGSKGDNFLQAGSGRATLFGGGSGDQLYAAGDQAQALFAGSGNETLSGAFASGPDTFYGGSGSDQVIGGFGADTFVAGTGAATVTAGPWSANVFDFIAANGGGTEVVSGLTSATQVHIELSGFGANEVTYALDHQTVTNGSITVTLSDNTTVTFQNVGKLTGANFNGGDSGARGNGWINLGRS